MTDIKLVPYKKWFGDIAICGQYGSANTIRIVVRMLTAHCFYWIGERYLGKRFSLNPFRDIVVVIDNDRKVTIAAKWLPLWIVCVSINDTIVGERTYYFGSFIFYFVNILAVLLILTIL